MIPHYTHQCSRAGQRLDAEPWVRLSSRWSSMFCRRRFSLVRWGQLGGAVIKIVRFLPAANMKGATKRHTKRMGGVGGQTNWETNQRCIGLLYPVSGTQTFKWETPWTFHSRCDQLVHCPILSMSPKIGLGSSLLLTHCSQCSRLVQAQIWSMQT